MQGYRNGAAGQYRFMASNLQRLKDTPSYIINFRKPSPMPKHFSSDTSPTIVLPKYATTPCLHRGLHTLGCSHAAKSACEKPLQTEWAERTQSNVLGILSLLKVPAAHRPNRLHFWTLGC